MLPQVILKMSLSLKLSCLIPGVQSRTADDLANSLNHPLAAGVGIPPGQLHGGDISTAEFAILINDCRRNVHAVLATTFGDPREIGGWAIESIRRLM